MTNPIKPGDGDRDDHNKREAQERESRERTAKERDAKGSDLGETTEVKIGDKTFDLPPDSVLALNTAPNISTVEGKDGTERVILTSTDNWSPAPVDPDPKEVARLKAMQGALEAKKAERLDALKVS